MAEQTLKFDNTRVNKKELHKSKQPIDLMSVNVDQNKIKQNTIKKALSILLVTKKWNCLTIMYYFTSHEWVHQML